jgi:PKD repeat protein
MKKLLLIFICCAAIVMANAQNNTPAPGTKPLTVREIAAKKQPLAVQKAQMARAKTAKDLQSLRSAANTKSGGDRNSCIDVYNTPTYTYLFDPNGDSTVLAYAWNFGDGSPIETTSYPSTGHYFSSQNGGMDYVVCLTKIYGGGTSVNCCDTVHIADSSSYCYSNFYYYSDTTSSTVDFYDYSSSADSIVSWGWDFGDNTGSLQPNPTHVYSSPGVYTVCLTITTANGCSNTYCYNVYVNGINNPNSTCSAYFSSTGAFGFHNFSDLSSLTAGNIISWTWDFGDTTTLGTTQNPSHYYGNVGTYYVCLTITTDSGCTSTYCDILNNQVQSTLQVDTISNLTQTLTTLLFGSCVDVTNLTYTGSPDAIGYFSDPTAELDSAFTGGLLLTTGSVFNAPGPNNQTSAGSANGFPGDTDLNGLIPGYTTYDAAVIEFDFSSTSDTIIASDIVFASEEYPEWVGSSFNDVFGFYISGPGITGTQNLAVIPSTVDPISINSVNPTQNASYYVDNSNGITYQYDGRTSVIQLRHAITPGQTYHFKIAIADAGDEIYDSGVLLKAGSFNGNAQMPNANFTHTVNGLAVNFINTSSNSTVYGWNFGDGNTSMLTSPTHTYAAPGTYTVTLFASNVCYSDTTSFTVTVGTTGISALDANNPFVIAPTGTEGVYTAYMNSSVNEKIIVKVYNVSGQVVMNNSYNSTAGQNNFTLDLSTFANGIYTVQVAGEKEVHTSKVIR